jgi:hypothetical protein
MPRRELFKPYISQDLSSVEAKEVCMWGRLFRTEISDKFGPSFFAELLSGLTSFEIFFMEKPFEVSHLKRILNS